MVADEALVNSSPPTPKGHRPERFQIKGGDWVITHEQVKQRALKWNQQVQRCAGPPSIVGVESTAASMLFRVSW